MGPIDRTLSGATRSGQSGPWSNSNEGVLHIPQCFSIRLFDVISKTLVGENLIPQHRSISLLCFVYTSFHDEEVYGQIFLSSVLQEIFAYILLLFFFQYCVKFILRELPHV